MWNILYMDMFKTGIKNYPETLTAVGGGVKHSSLLRLLSEVLT